jgi:hypothetical protein
VRDWPKGVWKPEEATNLGEDKRRVDAELPW